MDEPREAHVPFQIATTKAEPTLDHVVTDAATGTPLRVTVAAGVVVAQAEQARRMHVFVAGRQPTGEPVGFYVPGIDPLPITGEVQLVAEASLAQVVVNAGVDNVDIAYGVGDVTVQLVDAPDGTVRWVYLGFGCYGGQPLAVRYRVTVVRPAG